MPNLINILNDCKLRKVADQAVSAGTDVEGAVVDMSGFENVLFFVKIATSNAANFIKVQQGDEDDLSDAADLEGSAVVAAEDGDVVAIEIRRPTKRYVRAVIDRGGANTAVGDMYAVQGNARLTECDNNESDEIVSEILNSPDEGTA